jgi:hypothetical protein
VVDLKDVFILFEKRVVGRGIEVFNHSSCIFYAIKNLLENPQKCWETLNKNNQTDDKLSYIKDMTNTIEVWGVAVKDRRGEMFCLGSFKTEEEAYRILFDFFREEERDFFEEEEYEGSGEYAEWQTEGMKLAKLLINQKKTPKEILEEIIEYFENYSYDITKSIISIDI